MSVGTGERDWCEVEVSRSAVKGTMVRALV